MKFSTRQDTQLPADQLFDAISDFSRAERLLLRRGISVRRIDPAQEPGVGMAWEIAYDWRGKRRDLRLDVGRYDRPEHLRIVGVSSGLNVQIDMTVIALTRKKSRLVMETDIRPRNMRTRLLIQTARLGKNQLDQRYEKQVAAYVKEISA